MFTEFQCRVYYIVSCIPRGCVITYAMLARAVGCSSARAIGQVLKRNPLAPLVPCHRVIASDLTPGGYCGSLTPHMVRKKVELLASEGVYFKSGKLANKGNLCSESYLNQLIRTKSIHQKSKCHHK